MISKLNCIGKWSDKLSTTQIANDRIQYIYRRYEIVNKNTCSVCICLLYITHFTMQTIIQWLENSLRFVFIYFYDFRVNNRPTEVWQTEHTVLMIILHQGQRTIAVLHLIMVDSTELVSEAVRSRWILPLQTSVLTIPLLLFHLWGLIPVLEEYQKVSQH